MPGGRVVEVRPPNAHERVAVKPARSRSMSRAGRRPGPGGSGRPRIGSAARRAVRPDLGRRHPAPSRASGSAPPPAHRRGEYGEVERVPCVLRPKDVDGAAALAVARGVEQGCRRTRRRAPWCSRARCISRHPPVQRSPGRPSPPSRCEQGRDGAAQGERKYIGTRSPSTVFNATRPAFRPCLQQPQRFVIDPAQTAASSPGSMSSFT